MSAELIDFAAIKAKHEWHGAFGCASVASNQPGNCLTYRLAVEAERLAVGRDQWRDADARSAELGGRYRERALAAEREAERLAGHVANLQDRLKVVGRERDAALRLIEGNVRAALADQPEQVQSCGGYLGNGEHCAAPAGHVGRCYDTDQPKRVQP